MKLTNILHEVSSGTKDKKFTVSIQYNDASGNVATKRIVVQAVRDGEHAKSVALLKHAKGLKNARAVRAVITETIEPSVQLADLKAQLASMPQNPGSQEGYDAIDDLRDQIAKLEQHVDNKQVSEDAFDRKRDHKAALAKLYNDRAALRNQIKSAREERDREKVSELESKLSRLGDKIDSMESVDESVLEDANSAGAAYAARTKNVMMLLQEIGALMELHQSQQSKDANSWGYAGDLSYVESELRKVSAFLKGEAE
jgi:hypothetical protein